MVVFTYLSVEDSTVYTACKPVIDLSDANAKTLLVKACTDIGFSMKFLNQLEAEFINFFNHSKEFGYGSRTIGRNGDIGWVEYLLFCSKCQTRVPGISNTLWELVMEYVEAVKDMACLVAEMMRDEKGNSCFRVNRYPGFSNVKELDGWDLIMSILRSNDAAGLEICLKIGKWATVPSDNTTFFFTNLVAYEEFTWADYKKSAYTTMLGANRLSVFEKFPYVAP